MEVLLHEFARCVALVIEASRSSSCGRQRQGAARLRPDHDRDATGQVEKRVISLEYAHWLVAGLTFQLAADVVSTSFAPSWNELGGLRSGCDTHFPQLLPRSRNETTDGCSRRACRRSRTRPPPQNA